MPLRVHCPNGCLIRVPGNRAGTSIRCSECKAIIKLATVSKSESQSGKPIPIIATLVESPSVPTQLVNDEQIVQMVNDEQVVQMVNDEQVVADVDSLDESREEAISLESKNTRESKSVQPSSNQLEIELNDATVSKAKNVPQNALDGHVSDQDAHVSDQMEHCSDINEKAIKGSEVFQTEQTNLFSASAQSPLEKNVSKMMGAADEVRKKCEEQPANDFAKFEVPAGQDNSESIDLSIRNAKGTQPSKDKNENTHYPGSQFDDDGVQQKQQRDAPAPEVFPIHQPATSDSNLPQAQDGVNFLRELSISQQDLDRASTDSANSFDSAKMPVVMLDVDTKREKIENLKIELLDDAAGSSGKKIADDHRVVARFYGLCLAILGLVSLAPAIIFLFKLNQAGMNELTPRWIFLLIFVGALHVVYSIYLMQISDWSALWAISVLMLVASCMYGMFSAAILLDDGYGVVVQFLQISSSQQRAAMIWCLIGLCFSVLTSYLCGREAINWRRNSKVIGQFS